MDFVLHVFNRIIWFDFKNDSLSNKVVHKDLHSGNLSKFGTYSKIQPWIGPIDIYIYSIYIYIYIIILRIFSDDRVIWARKVSRRVIIP